MDIQSLLAGAQQGDPSALAFIQQLLAGGAGRGGGDNLAAGKFGQYKPSAGGGGGGEGGGEPGLDSYASAYSQMDKLFGEAATTAPAPGGAPGAGGGPMDLGAMTGQPGPGQPPAPALAAQPPPLSGGVPPSLGAPPPQPPPLSGGMPPSLGAPSGLGALPDEPGPMPPDMPQSNLEDTERLKQSLLDMLTGGGGGGGSGGGGGW